MSIATALIIGLVAGISSGMLGIGGGLVTIPAMILLLGVEQHMAQGVSLCVIVLTASVGAAVHYRLGNVQLGMALLISPAAAAFSILGAWVAGLISDQWLERAFAIFLLLIGSRMLLLNRGGHSVDTDRALP